jgi:hypothetical protein
VVESDRLTITHSGLTAKVGGLVRDQPRTIPPQAISGVAMKDATRMTNGWITPGLGGADAAALSAGKAPSDPNTVMFRHKDKDQFKQLHDWLVSVVQHNHGQGVDFSSVVFNAAGPARLERMQATADGLAERAERNQGEVESQHAATEQPRQETPEFMSSSAGWHPDPLGRFDLRYWNGQEWTEHVSRQGQTSTDPMHGGGSEAAVSRGSTTEVADQAQPEHAEVAKAEIQGGGGFFARRRADRQEKAENREAFEALAMQAAHGDDHALAQLPTALADTRANWKASKLDEKLLEVYSAAARSVIDDDVMTTAEEQHLVALGQAMGLDFNTLKAKAFALFEELVIAGMNDGRIPVIDDPPMVLKRDELAHASFGCALMKEVARREFRAGTSSVSIPLGAGVRYRVGGVRGKSVVVGTDLVAEDQGVLVVTSKRCMFLGQKKTLKFRHDRLVSVEQYADGLRLNVSNRQTASLLRFGAGQSVSIAAALISLAQSRV